MRIRRRRVLRFTLRTPEGVQRPALVDLDAPSVAGPVYTDDELDDQLREAGITPPPRAPSPRPS